MDETMNETARTPPFAPFEWVLSGRYLRARRKEGFISVIAGFSFLGIMYPLTTLGKAHRSAVCRHRGR